MDDTDQSALRRGTPGRCERWTTWHSSTWSSAAGFARWAPPAGPVDAVVVLTHTGETAFARRCWDQAPDAGVPSVAITGRGTSSSPEPGRSASVDDRLPDRETGTSADAAG